MGVRNYGRCALCGLKLQEHDRCHDIISLEVLKELTGTEYTKTTAASRSFHESCLNKLDIATRRRLLLVDFTDKLLSLRYQLWIKLDEKGKWKIDSLWSDLPWINRILVDLKKKGEIEKTSWLYRAMVGGLD